MWFRTLTSLSLLSLLLWISLGASEAAYHGYDGHQISGHFQNLLEKAMKDVQSILDTTRYPVIASDDKDHSYDDKYALVETVTNSMLSSVKNIFDQFGVNFDQALEWVKKEKRSVHLQFTMINKSEYVKQSVRKLEALLGGGVTYDHTFSLDSSYNLELIKGGGEEQIPLKFSRNDRRKTAVVAGGDGAIPPNPFSDSTDQVSLDITWIVEQLGCSKGKNPTKVGQSKFSIDRLDEDCKTPRRNPQVEEAWTVFVTNMKIWSEQIIWLLIKNSEQLSSTRHQLEKYSAMVFSPVVPVFENHTSLENSTIDSFLHKHQESLEEVLAKVLGDYKNERDYLSGKEASLALLAIHLGSLVELWHGSVDLVEHMLYRQLEEAIGKRLAPQDFQDFVNYHAKNIFENEFAPQPFAYTVRRGQNYHPDGMLSLEGYNHGKPWEATDREHVHTMVRTIPGGPSQPPVAIPLTPATFVEIRGDRFLHGWLQSQWVEEKAMGQTFLVARAHQFSNFMLVIGQMRGSSDFLPQQAIILQNKDEVLIPLLTSVLPSAKEFKDSIASLSPEQQDFARAFREMQLGSSVVGVCVIQVKPQLERLLNLPEGALTKEIQLTQTLMDLFVEHQIPSDLLSYDGDSKAPVAKKIAIVKGYVKAVANVIGDLIAKQVKDEKLKKEIHKAQQYHEDDSGELDNHYHRYHDVPLSMSAPPASVQYSAPPVSARRTSKPDSLLGYFFNNKDTKERDTEERSMMYSLGARRGPKLQAMHRREAKPMPPQQAAQQQQQQSPSKFASDEKMYDRDPYFDEADEFDVAGSAADLDVDPPAGPAGPPEGSSKESKDSVRDASDDTTSWSKDRDRIQPESTKEPEQDLVNFSFIPKILDARIEKEDKDGALKSTIIKPGSFFHRSRRPSIIQDAVQSILDASKAHTEKNRAMDLLTAISRSGSLPIEASELHVIVGMTHCFPKQIMETIIEDNVNPIQKVEQSLKMIASVIHGKPVNEMDLTTKTMLE